MCVKCLSSLGRCNDSHLINGIQWAIENGCDVISMSLGGHEHSSAEQTILRNACVNVLTAGVIASIAAGNEGDELNQYPIPDNIGLPMRFPLRQPVAPSFLLQTALISGSSASMKSATGFPMEKNPVLPFRTVR